MKTFKVVITSKIGLHARPAMFIAREAERYRSKIEVEHGSARLNGKSMLSLAALAVRCRDTFTVYIDGPDEEEAEKGMKRVCEEQLLDHSGSRKQ